MIKRFILLALPFLLCACPSEKPAPSTDFRSSGELRVATREDAISYQIDKDGNPFGLEYDLLEQMGRTLGVPVVFTAYADAQSAIDAVLEGKEHLAAAGLARNDALPIAWSAPIRALEFIVVAREDQPGVENTIDLTGKTITVRQNSFLANVLTENATRIPGFVVEQVAADDQTLLEGVVSGRYPLVATDRVHYNLAAQLSPSLTIVANLEPTADVAWAMPANPDNSLPKIIEAYFASTEGKVARARTSDYYIGHLHRLGRRDIAVFLYRVGKRLPEYQAHFREAETLTGIDWRYLAALSYQESHWNPAATSKTGVRGMMMLTIETADWLGVENRLDPKQSILGGSRYFAMLKNQLPETIPEPDRTWMATASYNLGMKPLNNARILAKRLDKDNTAWWDMKTVLPLLAKQEYADMISSARVRGGEAVIMTENIRNFYAILLRLDALDALPIMVEEGPDELPDVDTPPEAKTPPKTETPPKVETPPEPAENSKPVDVPREMLIEVESLPVTKSTETPAATPEPQPATAAEAEQQPEQIGSEDAAETAITEEVLRETPTEMESPAATESAETPAVTLEPQPDTAAETEQQPEQTGQEDTAATEITEEVLREIPVEAESPAATESAEVPAVPSEASPQNAAEESSPSPAEPSESAPSDS